MKYFSILLESIYRQEGVSGSAAIATILSTAKSTLEKLNQLVQVKLLKNIHGTFRARKMAWARNKSKVYKWQNELKELRAILTAAMGARSLLVSFCCFAFINTDDPCRSSAIRAETALDSMSHCLNTSEKTSLSLDRHLLSIQQMLTQTFDAVSAQGVAVNQLLHSHVSDLNLYPSRTEHEYAWPLCHDRKSQHEVSRLCSYRNSGQIFTNDSLVNLQEDQVVNRERKSAVKFF